MSASVTSSHSPAVTSERALTPAEIDASCRVPLLLMFLFSAIWLLAGSVFGLIASIKFHSPNFLADCAELTYGRVRPAQMNAWIYGAAIQGGIAVALWILCRLGQTRLVAPGIVTLAALFWNFGAVLSVGGILRGDTTGFEWLEIPRYASPILFFSYVVIGISAVLTLARRRTTELFVSQWFILAALFWFPWIFSTAALLLTVWPVRGVVQSVVHWWYANNLTTVWFAFVGLAASFYFIPKILNRPLQTRYLALFVFWTLALFGSWAGIPADAPVPAWLPSLSTAAALLLIVPIYAVFSIVRRTTAGAQPDSASSGKSLCFIMTGTWMYIVAASLFVLHSLREVSVVTQFTWFVPGLAQLIVYGFFVMILFGAIYYIVPQLTAVNFPSQKLVRWHFWAALAGIVILILPLLVGGVVQGFKVNDAQVKFIDTVRATLPFLRASTIGDLLLAAGHVFLLVNLLRVMRLGCCNSKTEVTA